LGAAGFTASGGEIRLKDKTKALQMLFKHLGLRQKQPEHPSVIEVRWKGE
jgi:hypothetical protein